MFERLAPLGASEILLELKLENAKIGSRNQDFLAAASSLFRLISGFALDDRSETGRLPLGLLAQYNLNAAQLQQESHPAGLAPIIAQLAGIALHWFSQGRADLQIAPETGACSHLQLRWAMEERRLKVIRKDPGGFLKAGKRFGPADAWFAWRFLRGLK